LIESRRGYNLLRIAWFQRRPLQAIWMMNTALERLYTRLASNVVCWFALSIVGVLAYAAPGEPDASLALSGSRLVQALQQGGLVIYFRHADTGPPYAEPGPVDFQRCDTQRNLNDHGREQARAIGAEFRRLGIPVGEIFTSEFCRCWQTAELAFGRYRKVHTLTGVSRDPESAERRTQAAAGLRELLASRPTARANTVLVSHGYNLFDLEQFLLGTQGEAAIYLPDGQGRYGLVARLAPEDWAHLPQVAQ
jgi:phosphohistidine phosphatase SixA